MPFLTTAEVQNYLKTNSIDLSDEEIRDLIKRKDVKGHRKYSKYVYDQQSVEEYAENPQTSAKLSRFTVIRNGISIPFYWIF